MPKFDPFYPPQWAAEEAADRPKTPCCNADFFFQEVTDNVTGARYSVPTCWECFNLIEE